MGYFGNNVYGQTGSWLKWEDPDKQFSFQYPSYWTPIPRENRFEDQDVQFKIGNMTTLSINVYNTSDTDVHAILDRAIDANKMNTALIKPKLFEGPDYYTYTVSGKPAGSVTWVSEIPFLGQTVFQNIVSVVGDKFVGIEYISPANDFDNNLSTVEKIIQSIVVNE